MQKIYSVEKIMPGIFFQKSLKMVSYEKSENVQLSVFQKRSIGRFQFFFTSNFLITFEKIHKA